MSNKTKPKKPKPSDYRNIPVFSWTKEVLSEMKIIPRETYDDLITRMIEIFKKYGGNHAKHTGLPKRNGQKTAG